MPKIKVMVIDDSAVMRTFLSETLSKAVSIEVVGTAIDPYIAASKINKLQPDVITLDIEMPRMDGLTFLSKLMKVNPMPVIMVSSLTDRGADATVKALELGAIDFILKPNPDSEDSVRNFTRQLVEKVRAAASSGVIKKQSVVKEYFTVPPLVIEKKHTADVIIAKRDPVKRKAKSENLVAIGASTGGTEVIDAVLVNLPDDSPAIVIAQHMPEKFTEAFALRVNSKSKILVKEAVNGERIYRGMALVAPGGKHMLVHCDSGGYYAEINDGPPVNRHKPSVDVLFRSVSQCAGRYATGILCTGMGSDGAAGLLEMKQSGATTIAQSEESCVVYGMPKEAVKLGAADIEMDIPGIINHIVSLIRYEKVQ